MKYSFGIFWDDLNRCLVVSPVSSTVASTCLVVSPTIASTCLNMHQSRNLLFLKDSGLGEEQVQQQPCYIREKDGGRNRCGEGLGNRPANPVC